MKNKTEKALLILNLKIHKNNFKNILNKISSTSEPVPSPLTESPSSSTSIGGGGILTPIAGSTRKRGGKGKENGFANSEDLLQ